MPIIVEAEQQGAGPGRQNETPLAESVRAPQKKPGAMKVLLPDTRALVLNSFKTTVLSAVETVLRPGPLPARVALPPPRDVCGWCAPRVHLLAAPARGQAGRRLDSMRPDPGSVATRGAMARENLNGRAFSEKTGFAFCSG